MFIYFIMSVVNKRAGLYIMIIKSDQLIASKVSFWNVFFNVWYGAANIHPTRIENKKKQLSPHPSPYLSILKGLNKKQMRCDAQDWLRAEYIYLLFHNFSLFLLFNRLRRGPTYHKLFNWKVVYYYYSYSNRKYLC